MLFLRGLFLITLFSSCNVPLQDFDLDLKEKDGDEVTVKHVSKETHHNDPVVAPTPVVAPLPTPEAKK